MRNLYGYFTFDDYPAGNIGSSATETGTRQTGASSIVMFDRMEPRGYTKWATFEKGEFDFNKPLYTGATGETLEDITDYTSNENGNITSTSIVVTPDSDYSGSGFSLRLYNNDYTVTITVVDDDGTRTKTFSKTDDEFYAMPYSGLSQVTFTFTKVEPYHFLRMIGYSFGAIRKLQESDFAEEPEINNYFDVTSETFEYDTLDLTIRGNKENFNIVEGERITFSETGQEFYVASSKFNSDGTVTITAYDNAFRLNDDFEGMISFVNPPSYTPESWYYKRELLGTWLSRLLQGTHNDIVVQGSTTLVNSQKWYGVINPTSFREAARLLSQGNGIAIKRAQDKTSGQWRFTYFSPYQWKTNYDEHSSQIVIPVFNESNIISVPEIDSSDKIYKVLITKYNPKLNTSEKVEAYHGELEYQPDDEQIIEFSAPTNFLSLDYDFIMSDDDGNEVIATKSQINDYNDVISDYLTPRNEFHDYLYSSFIEEVESWVRLQAVQTQSGTRYNQSSTGIIPVGIIVKGYQFDVRESIMTTKLPNVATIFKDNIVDITDCTTMVYDAKTEFKNHLRYIYSLNKVLSFTSLLNATAGDYVRVKFDNFDFYGWISKKTDNLNGVYSYEVVCK